MSREIAGITVCNLCGKKFAGPLTVSVGAASHGRLARYLEQLVNHFTSEHREEDRALQLRALEYAGMLRMMNFKTGDPDLARQCDFLRWQIHQQTLSGRMSDENLTAAAAELTGHLVDSVLAVLNRNYHAGKISLLDNGDLLNLRTEFTEEIARQIRPEFEGLRNALEEPGKYEISRIQVPNPTGPPSNLRH